MSKYKFEIFFLIFTVAIMATTYLVYGNASAREVFGIDCEYLIDALLGNC